MSWTAEITGKAESSGMLVVTVRYTDGAQVIEEKLQTRDPNGDWPIPDIQARIKSLELVATKPIPVGDTITAAAEPTPISAEAEAFLRLVMKVRRLNRMAELGLTAAQDELPKAVADMNAAYSPEFAEFV